MHQRAGCDQKSNFPHPWEKTLLESPRFFLGVVSKAKKPKQNLTKKN
jgi:hypothetical protein